MKARTLKRWIVLPAAAALGLGFVVSMLRQRPDLRAEVRWQSTVSPGKLSSAHAFLANNCTSCHTPVRGVEAANCIACHANNQSLLQRQPTAFHADVRSCVDCHVEHEGTDRRPTQMDHATLAKLDLRQMSANNATHTNNAAARERTVAWIGQHASGAPLPPGHPTATREEAALSCIVCHSNQDRHRGLLGTDCIQCHTTTAWTIPEFRHPAPTSTSCVQCHQAPPSHYMGHFRMVSMTVAHQPFAQVSQCFLCHQTNDWNDIKGVGWYKHH
jgi:hypothetical protein